MELTIAKDGGLVFDPTDIMEEITLAGRSVRVPKMKIWARRPNTPDEVNALFADHEGLLLALLGEVRMLRERVEKLEAERERATVFDDAMLTLTRPEEDR